MSTLTDEVNYIYDLGMTYTFAFGEMGSYDSYGAMQFFVFAIFAFFIPLTLMNMLIAIMSDVYQRVQENAVSADAKSLADMTLEMEEFISIVKGLFTPDAVKEDH